VTLALGKVSASHLAPASGSVLPALNADTYADALVRAGTSEKMASASASQASSSTRGASSPTSSVTLRRST
jgi:hypothetical protein